MNECVYHARAREPHDAAVKFTNDEIRGEIRHRSNWIILFRQLTRAHLHVLPVGSLLQNSFRKTFLFMRIVTRSAFTFPLFAFSLLIRALGDRGFGAAIDIFMVLRHLRSIISHNFIKLFFELLCGRGGDDGDGGVYFLFHNSEYSLLFVFIR